MPFRRIYFIDVMKLNDSLEKRYDVFFLKNLTNENEKKELLNKNTINMVYDSFKLRCTMKSTKIHTFNG